MPFVIRLYCALTLAIFLPVFPALAQSRLVDEVLLKPSTVHSVAELPDGGFVIASDTTHLGDAPVGSSLLRFDSELVPQANWGPAIDDALALAFDSGSQRLYVGGGFATIGNSARPRLARLGLDGTVDPWTLVAGEGQPALGVIDKLALLPGGDLLAVHREDYRERRELLRVDAVTGQYSLIHRFDGAVLDLQLLDDGSVLVGGAFEFVNGSQRRGLVKLKAGTLAVDTGFAARPSITSPWSWFQVKDIALDSAGEIYVTGGARVHRLRADGSTEYSFESPYLDGNLEQIAFDAQGRVYLLSAWPTSVARDYLPASSGLRRLASAASNTEDPGFASPEVVGRGARLMLLGERLLLLGSLRTPGATTIGALALSAETGAPFAGFESLGSAKEVRLYGAVPADSGGALVFGEFTHTPGARLWGTLRLNAQGQRLAGPFMDFLGTPDSFSLAPGGELLYTSEVRPMPRPQDWGAQTPEASWNVGALRLPDGSRVPGEPYPGGELNNSLKSGVVSYGSAMFVAERTALRISNATPELPYTRTTLPVGTSRRLVALDDGAVVIDRGPPPPNAFSGFGGIGFWPPPPSSPVYLLYRWLPGPEAAVGLGPARTASYAELGGFDVDATTGAIYASVPGQTSAEPVWSIRRVDPQGSLQGETLSTLQDHWATGGLALDAGGAYVYVGGLGPASPEGERSPRVFRVSTADGTLDPAWPLRDGDAVSSRWVYRFGEQIFALSGTASGTYAAFYRTDDVLFEDSFER